MRTALYLDFISDTGSDWYQLEGYLSQKANDLRDLVIKVGDKSYRVNPSTDLYVNETAKQHNAVEGSRFIANISLSKDKKITIEAIYKGRRIKIKTNRYTGLANLLVAYKVENQKIFRLFKGRIIICKYSKTKHALHEIALIFSILLNWRLGYSFRRVILASAPKEKTKRILKMPLIVSEAIVTIPLAVILRIAYWKSVGKKTKQLWIYSDRGMFAGDNAEALFRYAMQQDKKPVDQYFAISHQSADFNRMASIGEVLDYGSFRYKLRFLMADKIISSQADIETTNPFNRQLDRFVDLMKFDYVFLQHGVIRHDLSTWLNRYEKNIKLFITSAEKEYNSILSNSYSYTEERIALTGLPRFDFLQSQPRSKLILAPTYRKYLAARRRTDKKGHRRYDHSFKDSPFRTFYNDLMNDRELLDVLKQNNMTGELFLHPTLAAQRQDFEENEYFKIAKYPYNYRKAFCEGSMLISDYSSVVFDFAYLKKPILYTQFDADVFYKGHVYQKSNFFDDKNDGFGKVVDNYQDTVKAIIDTIEQKCIMENVYRKRVDSFFFKIDKNNSKRVYQAILDMDNKV